MADNVDITEGAGKTIRADEVGGALYQVIKIAIGPDGSASDLDWGQQAMGSSLPVVIASDQSAVPVSGTVTATVSGTMATEAPAQTITRITGTKAGAADNELVATPGAGQRIVVAFWSVQLEATVATVILMKSGATNVYRFRAGNQGDMFGLDYFPGREWNLAANEALNMNLDAANSVGYNVGYWTEAV